jgi:hypothetical protein
VKTRIYEVAPTTGNLKLSHDGDGVRLVDAGSLSQAIRHCVAPMFVATIAKPKRVAGLMQAGVKVEQAAAE